MNVRRVMASRLSSERFDARIAMPLIWGVGLLILVLGTYKVASFPLSESELFFGLLLVLILCLQTIMAGILVGLVAKNPGDKP
jgi:hypothetical protein